MRRRASGFTLLELIAASAIMAMIALTMYAAMRVGFKARDRALAAVGPARSAEVAIDMVRRDLESALPPRGLLAAEFMGAPGVESPGTSAVQFFNIAPPAVPDASGLGDLDTNGSVSANRTGFRGGLGGNLTGSGRMSTSGSSSSSSRTSGDPGLMGGGVQRVEILVRPSAPGSPEMDLVRRTVRNLLAPTEPEPDEELLCRGVTAFTIRFFDGTQWYDEWDSTQYGDTVPMAVEVALELTRAQDPTRIGDAFATAGGGANPANVATYRTTRTFFLPCRDESVLLEGVAQ